MSFMYYRYHFHIFLQLIQGSDIGVVKLGCPVCRRWSRSRIFAVVYCCTAQYPYVEGPKSFSTTKVRTHWKIIEHEVEGMLINQEVPANII